MLMRIIGCALVAGVIAGGASALLQQALVVPLIIEAELYETGAAAAGDAATVEANGHAHAVGEAAHAHAAGEAAHTHGSPDGVGRVLTTIVMTVAVNVGFALLLLAGFYARDARPGPREGAVWGVAGFAALMLAPAAGLAPELPGSAAAALEARQIWWIATAASAAGALWLIAFVRQPVALAASVLLLAVPHIVGAPQPDSHEALAPAGLAAAFAARALAVGFVSWALLGAVAAWAWGRERATARVAA